jgi:antitoxin CptB
MNPPDILRKRLYYQSWHRGTREAELLLGAFADTHLSTLQEQDLHAYEALLACTDADIFDWLQSSFPWSLLPHNAIAERFYSWARELQAPTKINRN